MSVKRAQREIQVAAAPAVPLLVFDGDCGFCRQWVRRWQGITGDRVDYQPYQDVAARFPVVGVERFRARVWLIEPDGRATGGARGVLRLYASIGERPWINWWYERSPAFAAAAEWAYDLVAAHRREGAVITRWLWGETPERPRYRRTRTILLRALGVVYLAAFASLAVQVDGLIGRRGILPAAELLRAVGAATGAERYWELPTLLWLDRSDRALHGLSWGGMATAALLVAGVLPGPCLAVLWLSYLSLTVVGLPFMGYQWDGLLLESGLLAVLFAPWRTVWLGRARREPSPIVLWLIRWLVFRLMFLSGVVKLTSGDPNWRAWEAMKYHYETQPLPTWTSWYVHQLPPWFHALSVGFVFWAELVAPFLVFTPRRPRMLGFWSMMLLQLLIAATGNFGFFNLLTAVLLLALVEGRDWARGAADHVAPPPAPRRGWRRAPTWVVAVLVVAVTTMQGLDRAGWSVVFPESLEAVRRWVSPLRSLNAYGLFAIMTTERPEVLVEGSRDGVTWSPYAFRWKPGDVARRPRFTAPHLPRLDWQMWFAALARDCRTQPWFLAFERRLLEGSPAVLGLLERDPFPAAPPRYVRARLFLYRFTGRGARDWWRREEVGPYCPPIEL